VSSTARGTSTTIRPGWPGRPTRKGKAIKCLTEQILSLEKKVEELTKTAGGGASGRGGEDRNVKITTRGRYAVMAMVALATSSRGNPVPIQAIAETGVDPEPYLQQLFLRLRKQNIVKSVRGPGGGFILARDPSESPWGRSSARRKENPRGSVAAIG